MLAVMPQLARRFETAATHILKGVTRMARSAQTFEEVDRIVQKANLKQFRSGGAGHVTARAVAVSPGDVLTKLCAIWRIVGPIVRLIIKTPLIPKKWRDALETFANLMDTVCRNS